MDDYRDIITAGFAILCAALMLVAWLLLIGDKPERRNADLRIAPSVTAPQSISNTELVRGCSWLWSSGDETFLIQMPVL